MNDHAEIHAQIEVPPGGGDRCRSPLRGEHFIDESLMEAADLFPYEKVDIYNVSNGERFATYVIPGPRDSGTICLNGAAVDDGEANRWSPKCVLVDANNKIKKH